MEEFPFFKQDSYVDCGYACLKMVSKFYGRKYDPDSWGHKKLITKKGLNLLKMTQIAEQLGFRCISLQATFEELCREVVFPCIAYWQQNHFVVIYQIQNQKVLVADPASAIKEYSIEAFRMGWERFSNTDGSKEGIVLALKPLLLF